VANQPPVAADDSQLVLTLTTTTIPVLANDYDPDGDLVPSSLRIVAGPSIGTASVVGTSIRYVAPLTLAATTTITYEVCDSHGSCAQATLTITIV
jgi:hypothetical protein